MTPGGPLPRGRGRPGFCTSPEGRRMTTRTSPRRHARPPGSGPRPLSGPVPGEHGLDRRRTAAAGRPRPHPGPAAGAGTGDPLGAVLRRTGPPHRPARRGGDRPRRHRRRPHHRLAAPPPHRTRPGRAARAPPPASGPATSSPGSSATPRRPARRRPPAPHCSPRSPDRSAPWWPSAWSTRGSRPCSWPERRCSPCCCAPSPGTPADCVTRYQEAAGPDRAARSRRPSAGTAPSGPRARRTGRRPASCGRCPSCPRPGTACGRCRAGPRRQAVAVAPLLQLGVVAVAGVLLARHRLTVGEVLAASRYAVLATGVGVLVGQLAGLARARAAAGTPRTRSSRSPRTGARRHAGCRPVRGGWSCAASPPVRGARAVLDGVDLVVPGGTTLAVVGPVGGGQVAARRGRRAARRTRTPGRSCSTGCRCPS